MPVNCGDDVLDPHYCDDGCDVAVEHARIDAGAWVHSSVYATIIANPTSKAVWDAQIAAGKVIILPLLNGSMDGGSPVMTTGFGRATQKYSGMNFTATVKDPVYARNWSHYRTLIGATGWHFMYASETQIHITGKPVTVIPKAPITDSVTDAVTWESSVTWFEYFSPQPHVRPDIFACVNAVTSTTVFDTILTFTGATTDTAESVSGTVAAVSPTAQFQFNKDTIISGLPTSMSISYAGAERMTVDFPSDYLDKPFRYIHSDGTVRLGTFASGVVVV